MTRARGAQVTWAARPLAQRAEVLDRFRGILVQRRRAVAETIRREVGKPALEALATEVAPVLDHARFLVRRAPRALAPRRVAIASLVHARKRVTLLREPHGVVGVISPWNYPFMLAAAHALPALLAGNAVVLKPSEHSAATGLLLAELLHDAGVPAELFVVAPGGATTGAALVTEGCDAIFFTGSEATGRLIARACGERLIPCSLELGGSDPAIVLEDAAVDLAAAGIVWGRFSNCGQSCVAPKRVFVVAAVYDAFVASVAERVRALRVGDTATHAEVGPPIDARQRRTVAAQLEDACARGARVAARAAAPDDGRHAIPAVLVDVPADARVMQEETFGPLLPIVRVADEAEAVRAANATSFGLSASVWSGDRRRAMRVARQLVAGTVMVNDVLTAAGIAEVAHGGTKSSGSGRAHGLEGLLACTRTKTLVDDRLPRRPQPWWFDYTDSLDAFIELLHGTSLRARLAAFPSALPVLRRLLDGTPRARRAAHASPPTSPDSRV